MNYWLIGKIVKISNLEYGVGVKIRETKIGGTTKNGHEVGTVDQSWNCITSSSALSKYIKSYFKVGATVLVNGWVEQYTTHKENEPISHSLKVKIGTIDLWNMGDPQLRKSREKFNSSMVGDEKPTFDNDFDNDF